MGISRILFPERTKTRKSIKNIKISLLFLAALAGIGLAGWGLVPAGGAVKVDMLLILAVLAALVNGKFMAVITAIVWSLVRFGLDPALFIIDASNKIISLLAAHLVYTEYKRGNPKSSQAPHYAVFVAGFLNSLFWCLSDPNCFRSFWSSFIIKFAFETGFALAVLSMTVEQLKRHHILNGRRSSK